MTTLETFAARLAAGTPDSAAREAARLHVADTVAAWVAGIATAEGRALIRLRGERGGSALDDIAAHCAIARSTEIDDIHLASMITPGAIVVPAVLALAKHGDDVTTAVAAGYEAMVRLGRAIDGPKVLYRGIWPTYFAAGFGTAAAAAVLWRIDARQTAHALALALTLAAPGVGQQHGAAMSRWLAAGQAARSGVAAAEAVRAGFTSDPGLLDGNHLGIFGITPDLTVFTADSEPAITQTSFKPWCAARQTMAATQALREVLQVAGADEILEIEAFVLPPHLRMIDHGVTEGDRLSYLTSLPYQMAVAAFAPDAGFDIGKATPALTAPMRKLMGQIKITGDDAFLADYPRTWPARISVATLGGRYARDAVHVPGDPVRPFDATQVAAKFRKLVVPVAGAQTEDLLALSLAAVDGGAVPAALLERIGRIYDGANA